MESGVGTDSGEYSTLGTFVSCIAMYVLPFEDLF